MPVLPLASILHLRFKDMNFLDEDDRNMAIELLKANALATVNNNSLHTTIKEEPQGNPRLSQSFQILLKLTVKLNKSIS
jgi:hypothetical protein